VGLATRQRIQVKTGHSAEWFRFVEYCSVDCALEDGEYSTHNKMKIFSYGFSPWLRRVL
jgi:hypothetical protein